MSQDPPKNPYQAPISKTAPGSGPTHDYSQGPPQVFKWQRVYVICMTLMYDALMMLGICFFIFADDLADAEMSSKEWQIMGAIYGILGAVLSIVFAVGLFWRRGMGGWVYNIILIGIGLTSCCFWPATIPLIIFWIKHKTYIVEMHKK